MSVTGIYGVAHEAFMRVAREHKICPSDVRVLVALAEHGPLRSDHIAIRATLNDSQVRHSAGALRRRDLVLAESSDEKGGPPRQGVRFRLTLTAGGRSIAQLALADLAFIETPTAGAV